MDGDIENIFQKLNTILENKETSDNLKNILSSFSSSNFESSEASGDKKDTSTNPACDTSEKSDDKNGNASDGR